MRKIHFNKFLKYTPEQFVLLPAIQVLEAVYLLEAWKNSKPTRNLTALRKQIGRATQLQALIRLWIQHNPDLAKKYPTIKKFIKKLEV